MLTLGAVAVASALLSAVCATVLRRQLSRSSAPVRRAVTAVTALMVFVLAVEAWAHLMVDRSGTARAVAWMQADTGDVHRFPARTIEAGDRPLTLTACPEASTEILDQPVETAGDRLSLRDLLAQSRTTSFVVLRDRCVLEEHYGEGAGPETLLTSFSMAKSFLSTLVGVAIARGDLESLDEPVTAYLPELAERDDRFERITLRHLVTMTSGLRYEERGLPWSDDAVTYYSPDLRETALSAEVDHGPGERWLYNNYNPLLVGMVLERATGVSVAEYMQTHLWQPMGAERDASWSIDSTRSGFEKMESGVNATALDYARFGHLFAHGGRADGRQVVPAAWVEEATAVDTGTDPEPGYQYWWWVEAEREDRFFAQGNLGQFIYVDARADLVLVRTGAEYGIPDWPSVLGQVADRLE